MIQWEHAERLLWVWGIPILVAGLTIAYRRHRNAIGRFAVSDSLPHLEPTPARWRLSIRIGLHAMALGMLIVALAGPQWGQLETTLTARGTDLFVLLDVSRSMLAKDVVPNRLERAKADLRDLLPHLQGDRAGLIVFAGVPLIQIPLTTDHEFFLASLSQVEPASAPRGGSLIGDAIRKALTSFESREDCDRAIVLITDGEDQESFPEDAARQAARQGVQIIAVGLGDPKTGRPIPVENERGEIAYARDRGQIVLSRLNDALLRKIAAISGGAYIPAQTLDYDLGQIYRDHLATLVRGARATRTSQTPAQRFQLFALGGFLMLLIERCWPKFPSGGERFLSSRVETLVQPGLRGRSVVRTVLMLLLLGGPVAASDRGAAARQVASGITKFQQQDYDGAVQDFVAAERLLPEDASILFDRACALAGQGRIPEAAELFARAHTPNDRRLTAECLYNQGCLAASQGQQLLGNRPEEAAPEVRQPGLTLLKEAAQHYRACLELAPDHVNARHNLELLRLGTKQIQEQWQRRDREQQRRKHGFWESLEAIRATQQELLHQSQRWAGLNDGEGQVDAPRSLASRQRELTQDVDALPDKLREALTDRAAARVRASGPKPLERTPSEDLAPVDWLQERVIELRRTMDQASDQLERASPFAAAQSQTEAVAELEEVFLTLAPWELLLKRALSTQQSVVDQIERQTSAEQGRGEGGAAHAASPQISEELVYEEKLVARWAERLGKLASDEYATWSAQPIPAGPPPPPVPGKSSTADPQTAREARKELIELAARNGPLAAKEAAAAGELLQQADWAGARPRANEALRLLQEIASRSPASTPPPPEQQPSQSQQSQSSPSAPAGQDDRATREPPTSSQRSQSSKESPDRQPSRQPPATRETEDPSADREADAASLRQRQDREAILRQVRQREQEYRERVKARRGVLGTTIVERDW